MRRLFPAVASLCASAVCAAQTTAPGSVPVDPLRDEREQAMAQHQQPQQLESIVVIGEKLGRTLDETASSVAVVSGRQLDDYGDDNVYQSFKRMGNVADAGDEYGYSIRGVSVGGAEGAGTGAPVISTYLDGVALDNWASYANVLDAFDVNQAEVLRGAQSTSQGRNAMAGAVVVSTREPADYWDLRARVRAAQLGERQYALAGGGPIGAGFSFRLMGDYQRDDGYLRNVTLNDPTWGAHEEQTLRGKLAWKPASLPEFSALLSLAQSQTEAARQVTVEPYPDDPAYHRTASDDYAATQPARSRPASLRLNYAFAPGIELVSTTGYVQSKLDALRDLDQTADDNGVSDYRGHGRNLTQELRLSFERGKWKGIAGLYGGRFEDGYVYRFTDVPVRLSEVPAFAVFGPIGDQVKARTDGTNIANEDARNIAAFTEFDYAFSPHLTLTLGLRYDRESSEHYTLYRIDRADADLGGLIPDLAQALETLPPVNLLPVLVPLGVIPGSDGGQTSKASYHALLPKLGIRWAVTPDLTAFFTYAEAYRAGGADIIPTTGELRPYDPEYTANYETGLRLNWWDGRINTRLNLYYTNWQDQQVNIPTDDLVSYYTENAASSILYGGEFENSLRLPYGFQAYLNWGIAHTEFREYMSNDADYSGNRFVNAPAQSGGAGFTWRGWNRWFGSASVSHTAAAFFRANNEPQSKSDRRSIVDARFGYDDGRCSVTVFGRNLGNVDYASSRYFFPLGLGITQESRLIGYGEPRVIGLQLELKL